MRKESLNIAIACFIGTALGLLVAFKLAEMFAVGRYLWFLGAFLGAGVAYLAYAPVSVWNAAKRAWGELADRKQVRQFLYRALSVTAYAAEVVALAAVIIAGIVFTFAGGIIGAEMHLWEPMVAPVWVFATFGSFVFSYLGFLMMLATGKPQEPAHKISFRKGLRIAALLLNPVSFPLVLAAGSLFFLWKVGCGLTRLLYRTFVLVHSTERTVCVVDRALGVAVAYTLVSPTLTGILAGGLIGLALGVLNYEIFSVRILKLAPARARK